MKHLYEFCECQDPGCETHQGKNHCLKKGKIELERVDMVEAGSLVFCPDCTSDAMESGLFRELGTVR